MKYGRIEPSDAEILTGIYNKIDHSGNLTKTITPKEGALIYCLAQSIRDGLIVNAQIAPEVEETEPNYLQLREDFFNDK
ncbi:MAG: hypothetical protein LUG62_01205 [Clostridiales bacterium]|nr:hypothetical protein [Clostridiales bacterium]